MAGTVLQTAEQVQCLINCRLPLGFRYPTKCRGLAVSALFLRVQVSDFGTEVAYNKCGF